MAEDQLVEGSFKIVSVLRLEYSGSRETVRILYQWSSPRGHFIDKEREVLSGN